MAANALDETERKLQKEKELNETIDKLFFNPVESPLTASCIKGTNTAIVLYVDPFFAPQCVARKTLRRRDSQQRENSSRGCKQFNDCIIDCVNNVQLFTINDLFNIHCTSVNLPINY